MQIQTYRAASMREALDLVRSELGGDAIVLSTRQVRLRRRFPWQRARHEAEVVAGLAEQTAPLRSWTEPAGPPTSEDPPADQSPVFEPAAPSIAAGDPDPADLPRGNAMESLVARLSEQSRQASRCDVPDELFHVYAALIDAEMEDDDARSLVRRLKADCTAEDLSDAVAIRRKLSGLVEQDVHCCGAIQTTRGVRKVVALVGPTGVGKTTSIAKLAANFKLRDGLKVGLVTVDTYRVAAVEQLRTYAEIIDLPMHVVTSREDMRRALQELAELDLVLIDTAGRSPRDELKIHELKSLLAESGVDEVHLVLSAASSIRSIERAAEKFRPVGPTAVLLTKLDEVGGVGCVVSVARRVHLPISYFTTGQDVPDDIEPAAPRRAARILLGQEDLFHPRPPH